MSEEGQPPTPQPSSRGGRWFRRIAVVLLLCITAGLLFYNLFVPTIAKNVATGILEDLGFKEVELQVHAVSTSGLYASNLREGSDHFRIGAIGVNYNVSDLLDGKIETITLIGVEWEMQIRDGQITIAPFDALPKSTDDEPAGELPFKTVRLQSSIVGIDWDGYKLRIPVDATITNEGDQQFSVVMNLDLLGTPLQIKGDLKPETDEHGHQLTAVSADIQYLKTPWSVRGKINPEDQTIDIDVKLAGQEANSESPDQDSIGVEMAFHRYSDGHSLQLDIWTRQNDWKLALFGDTAEATKLEAQLSLAINEELKITEMLATFESPNMSWNDMTLRDVVVSLDQRDGMLNGLAQAAGEQWTTNIKADAPSIGQLLAGAKEHNINASWQLDGRIPHWIADQVARFGYRIDQREDAHFSGRATALLPQKSGDPKPQSPTDPNAGDSPSWSVTSDDITLAIGACDFQPSDGRFKLKELTGELKFAAVVTPAFMQWELKPESALAFDQASFGTTSPITIGANSFLFAPKAHKNDGEPTNQLTRNAVNGAWQGVAFAGLTKPLQIKTGTIEATIAQLQTSAIIGTKTRERSGESPVPVAVTIAFDQSSLSETSNDLSIKNISAKIPVGMHDAATGPGHFSLAGITYNKQALAPIEGTANLVDGMIRATANWKPLQHGLINAEAAIDISKGSPHGRITTNAPAFEWTDADQALLRTLVPAVGDIIINGTLAVDGHIDLVHGKVEPKLTITTQGIDVRSKTFDINAEQIAGAVTINRFTPIGTPGGQKLQIKDLKIGKMDLKKGTFAFRVESSDSIFIERTKWSWGEKGTFFVHAFRLQPSLPEYDIEVFIEDLDLNIWIDTLTDKRVDGSGLLYGRIPVTVRPKGTKRITFGQGFLYTDPRAKGTLQIHDSEMLRSILIQTDPRFNTEENMKIVLDGIVEALKDFQYDRLTFDFEPRPEQNDLRLRISTAGQSRDPNRKNAVPIGNLTVNLNGIDKLIDESLLWKRGSDNALDNALNGFFQD